ncbi:hypothetical protein ACFL6H_05585 [Candidatus Latescibacterota bacterium]
MDYTYQDLKKKNVTDLRDIASGIDHEAVQGYTQMNKEHVLKAICTALGIDTFEHHVSKDSHKTEIKSQIKALKVKRDEAIAEKNSAEAKIIRRKIHRLKRKLHKTAV